MDFINFIYAMAPIFLGFLAASTGAVVLLGNMYLKIKKAQGNTAVEPVDKENLLTEIRQLKRANEELQQRLENVEVIVSDKPSLS